MISEDEIKRAIEPSGIRLSPEDLQQIRDAIEFRIFALSLQKQKPEAESLAETASRMVFDEAKMAIGAFERMNGRRAQSMREVQVWLNSLKGSSQTKHTPARGKLRRSE